MKFSFSRLLVFALAVTFLIAQVHAEVVDIPDPNLRTAIREALELPPDAPITQQEMLRLTRLDAIDGEITDPTGLEHAAFLIHLSLKKNQIQDISPIAALTRLNYLDIGRNQIVDLSPLANLTNLKYLHLTQNPHITDLSPLANLTGLMELTLARLSITDITSLENLTQLTYLRLDSNQISDISPLTNLALLERLRIERNEITDISPLSGLTNLRELSLVENPIHDFSPLLELEGIELDIDIDLGKLDELNVVVEVPDPNLKQLISETLSLPAVELLTQVQMLRLIALDAGGNRGITDLTGLEYATNIQSLGLYRNPIVDISTFAHLTKLETFNLWGCRVDDLSPLRNLKSLRGINLGWNQISDVSPLSELTNLTHLGLDSNNIVDYSPLANLVNLEKLGITDNLGTDISSLNDLNFIEFHYDEQCHIDPLLPSIRERMESRSFPSIFSAWGGIGWSQVVNRSELSDEAQLALHDFWWPPKFGMHWDRTEVALTPGLGTQIAGPLAEAQEVRHSLLKLNPNMLFLTGTEWFIVEDLDDFPPDSEFWLRDTNNQIIPHESDLGDYYYINFLHPEYQDILVERMVAAAQCGLFDGIMLDGFLNHGTHLAQEYSTTEEEIITVLSGVFRRVRARVRDDFLILINANRSKPIRYAEFINGTFMETGQDHPNGYTYAGLAEIENTLLWAEENLRSPQINCLEGWGIGEESPNSLNNLRWMRVFTTMSLTHSDGYVMYNTGEGDFHGGPDHNHFWYPLWDADLGRPIGPQAQPYQDIEGLFIREFTNGWAVYNRSGTPQTITLPESATPVSDRGNNAASQTHFLPDLDGEIYLKIRSFADVNRDGQVDVLDLLQVANSLGEAAPDPNGDGVVNNLDLVFVAQQFSQ